jgi:hypothetical protein
MLQKSVGMLQKSVGMLQKSVAELARVQGPGKKPLQWRQMPLRDAQEREWRCQKVVRWLPRWVQRSQV